MSGSLLNTLSPEQSGGANPRGNAWVSASAGTGKTQVLIARVLRLLLIGARPESILCITFTKAGASEMARRIRERLALWVRKSDADLRKDLYAIQAGGHDDPATLRHARTLFAEVIDAPGGGLAIQTIHSFCQTLLTAFPDEAGLVPGFRLLDDRARSLLIREVLTQSIEDAQRGGDLPYLARLEGLSERIGEADAVSYLVRCAAAHRALVAIRGPIAPWLRQKFELPLDSVEHWLPGQLSDDRIGRADLEAVAASYSTWGTDTGIKRSAVIANWLASEPIERAPGLEELLSVFYTKKREFHTKTLIENAKLQPIVDTAIAVGSRLASVSTTAAQMRSSDGMADALEAGRHFARAVVERKRQEGVVDFDDLIASTAELLADESRSSWIRYKLDSRIDHILVDEAQDTNEAQWTIVEGLTDEFFAGEGAKDSAVRTLFVVGDFKQAIFGFQGTNPREFERARQRFGVRGEYADRPFSGIAIGTNYRSAPAVLEVVDATMEIVGAANMGLPDDAIQHYAGQSGLPGRVTLWPPIPSKASAEDDDDEQNWIDSGTRAVADRIARTAAFWLSNGLDGEPVFPSDIMVLVRNRSDIAALIVSRMQAHGVPVAGVDRLRLGAPLGVQDVMAAARFALQPLDDLNLASLLVSPLMGWTHEDLLTLGLRPEKRALWPHLRDNASLADRLAPLYDLLRMAGYVSPYRFFENILSGPIQGRKRLLSQLGEAARDAIEELLSQAISYEAREGASLHGFIHWFDSDSGEIKRESDNASDEVRVMTVHGSKGLQARIVILADALVDPARKRHGGHALEIDGASLPTPHVSSDQRPPLLAQSIMEKDTFELQEHWRLLYVAMTRAEQTLFVTGALRGEAPPPLSWYSKIDAALSAMGSEWTDDDSVWGKSRSYARGKADGRRPRKAPVGNQGSLADVPLWAKEPPAPESRPPRPLAPSSAGDGDALAVPQPPSITANLEAAQRGILMHSLFERLPSVDEGKRPSVADRWLAAQAPHLSDRERQEMAASVCDILTDDTHSALFGANSLAEVPFSAVVDGQVIAGFVDRLVVDDDAVHVVDYKTGQHVPARADDVPSGYLKQMAAYRAALMVIFPGREVRASLLYTSGPTLFDLPASLLDANKPGFGGDNAKLIEVG